MAIAVGTTVRFRPLDPPNVRNFNTAMIVTAIDESTGLVSVSRENKPAGVIHIDELLEVDP